MDKNFLDYTGLTMYTKRLDAFLKSKLSGFVPKTRTVNAKPLSDDISLTLSDVGSAGDGVNFTDNAVNVTNPFRGIFSQEEFNALSETEQNTGTYIIP